MSERRRYTAEHPCPICGGHARLARGQGKRCAGYLLRFADGAVRAYCARIVSDRPAPAGDLWAHRLPKDGAALVTRGYKAQPAHGPAGRTPKRWTIHHERHLIALHPYGGAHPFELARFDDEWRERGFPKSMPRHRNERGEWFTGIPPALRSMTDAPLYHQGAALVGLERGQPLYVVEGEADVDAIRALGQMATTNPCGAMKWKPHHTAALASIESRSPIRIVRDRDKEGTAHAAHVYSSLWSAGIQRARLSILEAAQGKDARDHLAAGFTLDELVAVPVRIRAAA